MTRNQYKALIHPLTRKQVAELCGAPFETVKGWSSGRYPVPKWFVHNVTKERVEQFIKQKGLRK